MNINPLLLDLEVISQINENDKLSVSINPGSVNLFIDTFSYTSSIYRWYYGYNRENSINYLEKLIDNIEKSSNTIIVGHHNDLCIILSNSIRNAIIGLNNLKKTYIKDAVISSKITLLINKLIIINKSLDDFLNNIVNLTEQ